MRALMLAAIACLASPAHGHDHWIRDGKYLDPVTGQHCCNENDCKTLSTIESVRLEADGGIVVDGHKFVRGQLHKSEDGNWWRCASRCVFRPVGG